jgi:hypothetical protein
MGGTARQELSDMNRFIWIVRILGILMILVFMVMFAYMQRRYMEMQGSRPPATQR